MIGVFLLTVKKGGGDDAWGSLTPCPLEREVLLNGDWLLSYQVLE